jgi:hypothetical protein
LNFEKKKELQESTLITPPLFELNLLNGINFGFGDKKPKKIDIFAKTIIAN